ncbi:Uncharacterised protein [Enterobacter hormaechei]|jgi:hypothetical protein|nr:hypothetical protein MS7884_2884 [Enterobacter hormaechei]EUM22378.1 hypothetical protein L464_00734 [Enterobacter sp. BIDMC 28]EUM49466.1 hypothetical protein L379_03627 [Enterobacter sp. MGH 33]KLW43565.1 hypothetical protein SK54_01487 [Enterobacter sp. MGH120]KLW46218.1 hypothetical protein SK52_03760 [Enterobacter sp. MGH86]KLW63271.1 hypothetical protein SK58_01476 [Enterobacter sp. BIDMC93]KLW85576.1 hypothetical protein SK63_04259 [Enterobacter sp. BIDMC110]CAE6357919.1 hypothetic
MRIKMGGHLLYLSHKYANRGLAIFNIGINNINIVEIYL